MSHNIAKTALLVTAAVTLSGCAQVGHFGNSMWGYTKSAANFIASPVTKLLRSAPEQDYVFEGVPQSQQVVKEAFAQDGHRIQPYYAPGYPAQTQPRGELAAPQLAQLREPQTPDYQARPYPATTYQAPQYQAPQYPAPAYTADSYQQDYNYADYPAVPPARIVEAAPRNTPQVTQEISFVKMGGGSDMQDWASCEAQAGGFVTVVQGGYIIDSGFESCMRSKGYKPESEAAHELSL
ncbi:hypothetical protein N9W89_13080 [Hellea sp.]|nr:hypothetical protein [Hellea sp.]